MTSKENDLFFEEEFMKSLFGGSKEYPFDFSELPEMKRLHETLDEATRQIEDWANGRKGL